MTLAWGLGFVVGLALVAIVVLIVKKASKKKQTRSKSASK
jgi:hypothetical protein